MRNQIIFGQKYMAVEEVYILDRLADDSRMTVHDSQNGYTDTRVVITRADADGYVYARVLDGRAEVSARNARSNLDTTYPDANTPSW